MLDLRSDTATTPTAEMRAAMADAEVGDAKRSEDPTVNELEAQAAEAVGKSAALFVPTGTMANQLAARVHADRDEEVLVERESHFYRGDSRGFVQSTSLQVHSFDGGERGIPPAEVIKSHIVGPDTHKPSTGLLTIENTHSVKGGLAIDINRIDEAANAAHDLNVPVHLDGSRLFNAAVALDEPAERVARSADSVMFCLSKGLGAPVGSVLVGPEEFVKRARAKAKRLGGGMRQAGVLASAGLVALQTTGELESDHEHARLLAARLNEETPLVCQTPETNIVHADTSPTELSASDLVSEARDRSVGCAVRKPQVVRLCVHRDLERRDIDEAASRLARIFHTAS
jgi:threonine aldolase